MMPRSPFQPLGFYEKEISPQRQEHIELEFLFFYFSQHNLPLLSSELPSVVLVVSEGVWEILKIQKPCQCGGDSRWWQVIFWWSTDQSMSSVPVKSFSSTNYALTVQWLFENLRMVRNTTDYAWKLMSFSCCSVPLLVNVAARCLRAASCIWQSASSRYYAWFILWNYVFSRSTTLVLLTVLFSLSSINLSLISGGKQIFSLVQHPVEEVKNYHCIPETVICV